MCAINGILGRNFEKIDLMNAATKHRGPDGTGVFREQGVSLGHNRLAIIDVTNRGAQPMKTNDGRYTIVFNGEIYNFKELRESIDYDFRSESDTEVLLVAFSTYGPEVLDKLKGIFSFAVWDSKDKRLFVARDQMGVKPLYYLENNDGDFIFSSELQGLLSTMSSKAIDRNSLSPYFGMHYVPSPDTIISGVKKLRPGHYLEVKEGRVDVKKYYNPGSFKVLQDFSLKEVMDSVVQRQLVSDRPIGLFLSGGLDSSIILHHMASKVKDLRTFSTSFEMVDGFEHERSKFNADAEIAKETAHYYGVSHRTYQVSLQEVRENIENVFTYVDEPVANPSIIAKYFLSKHSRADGVIVSYGGDGSDELFAGYSRHQALLRFLQYKKVPGVLRKVFDEVYPKLKKIDYPTLCQNHSALMSHVYDTYSFLDNGDLLDQSRINGFFLERYGQYENVSDQIQKFLLVDRETWLADESLASSDKMSMRAGQELRVPFLDPDIVSCADSIPGNKKLNYKTGKIVLREEYEGLLPNFVLNQPKRGWFSPGSKWLRDPVINRWVKEVFSSGYYDGLDPFFDWEEVNKLLNEHVEGKTYALYPLWNILTLQVWARNNEVSVYNA